MSLWEPFLFKPPYLLKKLWETHPKKICNEEYIDINWNYYLTFYSPRLVASNNIRLGRLRWSTLDKMRCGTGPAITLGNTWGWVHKAGLDPPFFFTSEPGTKERHVLLVENNLLICGISRNHWAPRWVLIKLAHSSDATKSTQLSFHYSVSKDWNPDFLLHSPRSVWGHVLYPHFHRTFRITQIWNDLLKRFYLHWTDSLASHRQSSGSRAKSDGLTVCRHCICLLLQALVPEIAELHGRQLWRGSQKSLFWGE